MASQKRTIRTALVGGVSHPALAPREVAEVVGVQSQTVKGWCQQAQAGSGPYRDMVCYPPGPGQKSWLVDLGWLEDRFPNAFSATTSEVTVADQAVEMSELREQLDFYKAYAPAEVSSEQQLAEALDLVASQRLEIDDLRLKLEQRARMVASLGTENADLLARLRSLSSSTE